MFASEQRLVDATVSMVTKATVPIKFIYVFVRRTAAAANLSAKYLGKYFCRLHLFPNLHGFK